MMIPELQEEGNVQRVKSSSHGLRHRQWGTNRAWMERGVATAQGHVGETEVLSKFWVTNTLHKERGKRRRSGAAMEGRTMYVVWGAGG